MAEEPKLNMYFMSLVLSLSQAAMQQMGKITNPLTGKIERNLEQAKVTIDMLEMLKEKTIGNLVKEEERLISDTLATLQLNYVDEVKKEEKGQEEGKQEKQEEQKE
jgi:DNA replication initiation complex subunit (GINS family)